MKLWMVVKILGAIAATVGPLPNGIDVCREQTAEFLTNAREKQREHNASGQPTLIPIPYRPPQPGDITMECVFSDERPSGEFHFGSDQYISPSQTRGEIDAR